MTSRSTSSLAAALALAALATGCADIGPHTVDVVVDDEGVVTRATIEFDEHFKKATNDPRFPHTTPGRVRGDAPILRAVVDGNDFIRHYDVFLRKTPPAPGDVSPVDMRTVDIFPDVHCRLYHSADDGTGDFGAPVRCTNTTRDIRITMTFRDGDDGS